MAIGSNLPSSEADSESVLRILLGGISTQEFLQTFWEAEHLWVEGVNNPLLQHVLPDLLTLEIIDTLLTTIYACGRRPVDSVTLVQDGSVLPPEKYLVNRIGDLAQLDVGRTIELHQQGASVALNSLHRVSVPISVLCRELSKFFGSPVHANVYVTPPRSQGFSLHYDTHDVYLVQIAGRKIWKLIGSSEPLRTVIFQDGDVAKAVGPRSEVELNAGDVLYIPRGMFHEGLTSGRMSAHITIGIQPYTWANLLRDTVMAMERDAVDFRRSATPPPNQAAATDADFHDALAGLSARIADPDQATAVLAAARAERLNGSLESLQGHLLATFARWPGANGDQDRQGISTGCIGREPDSSGWR